jgi:zinc D-Ala-D-Ala carboxypeptidase
MSRWTFFTEEEVKGLNIEFVDLLDRARRISGVPYLITSGKRTVEDNEQVGGAKESSHLLGVAVDLRCHDSVTRFKILKGLVAVGFCRIGIYQNHIHVDNALSFPQGVVWLSNEP